MASWRSLQFTLAALVATTLVGCKEAVIPSAVGAAADRVKAVVTGDRLPEKSSEAAIKNHGYAKLLEWAEGGDSKAQHFVAVANLAGNTVPKNYDAAGRWALRAANQGTASSQFLSGVIRADAAATSDLLAVEPNLIRAYMWFSLAGAQGHEPAQVELKRIEPMMDSRWIQTAQKLASEWRQCRSKTCQDMEPDSGLSSDCKNRPTSVLCP